MQKRFLNAIMIMPVYKAGQKHEMEESKVELRILDFIQTHLRTIPGDYIMIFLSTLGNAGLMWIVLTAILICVKKTRKTGYMAAGALVTEAVLCNLFLKILIARQRPFDANPLVELLVAKPGDYSFPSGHTSAAFAVITVLFLAGNKKLGLIFGAVGAGIAFSRLYLYVHYPTDVLGGFIVGVLSGVLAKVFYDRLSAYRNREKM